jgi:16S rRNA (guanine527-N7)-methyltransferase
LVIDIGSGAGFPGVVLKIARPDLNISLLDSSRKKVIFLREVCEQLQIRCPVVCQRSEKYQQEAVGQFDLVISRAVGTLFDLWKVSCGLLKKGGMIYVLKGGDLRSEIEEAEKENIIIRKILPAPPWTKFSHYLENKFIVTMEK